MWLATILPPATNKRWGGVLETLVIKVKDFFFLPKNVTCKFNQLKSEKTGKFYVHLKLFLGKMIKALKRLVFLTLTQKKETMVNFKQKRVVNLDGFIRFLYFGHHKTYQTRGEVSLKPLQDFFLIKLVVPLSSFQIPPSPLFLMLRVNLEKSFFSINSPNFEKSFKYSAPPPPLVKSPKEGWGGFKADSTATLSDVLMKSVNQQSHRYVT